ncbi:MmpS family transport accessory protein [Micromonospora sp. SL4-19]|uniref:MmpS family transport accessory protein n=1 Tax=Micromonospora sp. SL4-19 TaxID=3399129 RepID=UPI003A4D30B9
MSEPTPIPDPPAGGSPTDPTAPPAGPTSAPWMPPDPLATPAPWAPPTPWTPADVPGASGGPGTTTGQPETTTGPSSTVEPGTASAGHPSPAGPAGPLGGPPPAGPFGGPPPAAPFGDPPPVVPAPGANPPPGHSWPGHPAPAWPPAGYPPPYAYPGSTPPRTSSGWIPAVVVGVAAVLVLAFCGCVGLSVLPAAFSGDPVVTSEPYDEPGYGYPTETSEPYDEPDDNDTADNGLITAEPTRSPAATPSKGPGRHKVVYEVTGTTPADVTYYDANGDFIQVEQVKLPWQLKFTVEETDRLILLTRHSVYPDDSLITCRIIVDGKILVQETNDYGPSC